MTKKLFVLVTVLTFFAAIKGVTAQDVAALLDELKNADGQIARASKKEELVRKGGASALPGLIKVFRSIAQEDDELKWFAAVAIGQIVQNGAKENTPLDQTLRDDCARVFREMLATTQQRIRYWGIKGLILLNDPNIKEIILKEYNADATLSRWKLMLLDRLKELNAPELIDILIAILSDQESRLDFVMKALIILKDAKDPNAKRAVKAIMEERFLHEKQPLFIKKAAADALETLTEQDFRFPKKLTKKGAMQKVKSAIDAARKWWNDHKDDPEYK